MFRNTFKGWWDDASAGPLTSSHHFASHQFIAPWMQHFNANQVLPANRGSHKLTLISQVYKIKFLELICCLNSRCESSHLLQCSAVQYSTVKRQNKGLNDVWLSLKRQSHIISHFQTSINLYSSYSILSMGTPGHPVLKVRRAILLG